MEKKYWVILENKIRLRGLEQRKYTDELLCRSEWQSEPFEIKETSLRKHCEVWLKTVQVLVGLKNGCFIVGND